MKKYKIIGLILFFFCVQFSFAQSETDTLEVEEYDYSDTIEKKNFFNFGVGLPVLFSRIESGEMSLIDSISQWNSNPKTGFIIGLSYKRNLAKQIYFESGIKVIVSSVSFDYMQISSTKNVSFPYSLLEIPLLVSYKNHEDFSGFNMGVGFSYWYDISKQLDIDKRLVSLKKNDLAGSAFLAYTFLNKEKTHFEIRLNAEAGFFNLNSKVNNKLNNSILSIHQQMIGIQLSIF